MSDSISAIVLAALTLHLRSHSLRSVAIGADLDYGSLYRWVHEGRDVRSSTVDAVADYLGVTAEKTRQR